MAERKSAIENLKKQYGSESEESNFPLLEIGNMPELPYAVDESLNRLRINMGFLGRDKKRIMVVSSVPDEGKSFVSIMLWRKLAEAGVKSLLIDADLRKSVMIKKYKMNRSDTGNIVGLSEYLAGGYGDLGAGDVMYRTDIGQGYIIPNQKNAPRPSLLFQNGRMKELVDKMAIIFDRIIIDVAPMDVVSDGEMIGSLCDGAILVVRAGMTNRNLVKNSVRRLERAGCPVLGIVLSRAESKGSGYYSKRYGKYYGKRYYGGYGVYGDEEYYHK